MLKEAIILAGGKGTRLRSVTRNVFPKGLTPVKNKPILGWEMEWLAREGIQKVILATGHLAERIEDAFGTKYDTSFGSLNIEYSVEKEKLGSGGAIKLAKDLVDGDLVIVLNGDILTTASIDPLVKLHEDLDVYATMMGVNMVSPFGIVHHENSLVTKYEEKPRLPVPIHAGVDLFDTDVLNRFPTKGQMEETIFLELVKERKFGFHLISDDVFWMSIDTQKDFETANKTWPGLL